MAEQERSREVDDFLKKKSSKRMRSGALRAARRAASSGVAAQLRIVSVNDVYELHALPKLKSLIDARQPQLVP